jgi:hypothetical protein
MYCGHVLPELFTRSKSLTQNVAQHCLHAASTQLDCVQETLTTSMFIGLIIKTQVGSSLFMVRCELLTSLINLNL